MLVLVNDTDRNDISMLYQSITDSINECVSVLISDAYNPIRKMVIHIYEKLREMARKLILLLKPALIDFEITLSKIQHQTYTNINTIRGPPQILKKIYKVIGRYLFEIAYTVLLPYLISCVFPEYSLLISLIVFHIFFIKSLLDNK